MTATFSTASSTRSFMSMRASSRPTRATTRSSSASARWQLALQQASYAKQQRQVAHLQSFIDRFRAKATKAKQAQSRIKALERMELIAAAHVDSPFEFTFPPVDATARQLVLLERATLGYEGKPPVLGQCRLGHPRGRSHRAARSQRRGQVDAAQGHRRHAGAAHRTAVDARRTCRLGYFAQHQVEQLREDIRRSGICGRSSRGARTGTARFSGRLRLSRRHGHVHRWAASRVARRRA